MFSEERIWQSCKQGGSLWHTTLMKSQPVRYALDLRALPTSKQMTRLVAHPPSARKAILPICRSAILALLPRKSQRCGRRLTHQKLRHSSQPIQLQPKDTHQCHRGATSRNNRAAQPQSDSIRLHRALRRRNQGATVNPRQATILRHSKTIHRPARAATHLPPLEHIRQSSQSIQTPGRAIQQSHTAPCLHQRLHAPQRQQQTRTALHPIRITSTHLPQRPPRRSKRGSMAIHRARQEPATRQPLDPPLTPDSSGAN